MSKRKAMEMVDACRTPLKRRILTLAEEAAQQNRFITARSIQRALGYKGDEKLSSLSYQVRSLFESGALEEVGGERIRGSFQVHYRPSKAFRATMTDTVALDQIAELADDWASEEKTQAWLELIRLIRATGRPVEA